MSQHTSTLMLDDIRSRGTITVPEAGQVLGIGRDAAYRAAERGQIPTLRLGRTLRVPVPALLELLGAHTDSEAGASTRRPPPHHPSPPSRSDTPMVTQHLTPRPATSTRSGGPDHGRSARGEAR